MRAKITWGLALLSVALAVAVGYESNQVSQLQEQMEMEQSAHTAAEAKLKAMQMQFASVEEGYENLRLKSDAPAEHNRHVESAAAAARPEPRTNARERNFQPWRQDANGFAGGDRSRPMGPRQNGNSELVRSLKLSPSDAEKLLQVLNEDQDKFRQALQANGGTLDPATAAAMRTDADQHVRDLLGDEKYAEFDDYRKYQQEHMRVEQLNNRLSNSGIATLTDAQQQNLFTAMKEEKSRVAAPTQAQFATNADFYKAYEQWRAAYNTRTITRAETILTPDQLTRLPMPPDFPFRGPQPQPRP